MNMAIVVNRAAVEQAERLMFAGQYRMSTLWETAQPKPEHAERLIAEHGLEAYALWFLGIDTSLPEEDSARYLFPYGDLKSVHKTNVVRIKERAERDAMPEIAQAADDIEDLLIRVDAC
jgi:hypothetical protein